MKGDPSIKNIEMLVPSTQASMNFNFNYEAQTKYGIDCGKVKIKVLNADTGNPVGWALLDQTRLNIDLSSFGGGFTKMLRVEASLEDFPQSKVEQFFNVTLSQIDIMCLSYPNIEFKTGSQRINLQVAYTNNTKTVNPVTAEITPQWLDDAKKPLSWPPFLSFDLKNFTFSIETDSPETAGIYIVGLKITYKEY